LGPNTRVQLIELPKRPSSLLGVIGNLIGASAADQSGSVVGLPLVQSILRGIPSSVLVAPDGAQARLPYDIIFE
jgi:hypothetical protein